MITKQEYIKKWKDLYDFTIEFLCEPIVEIVIVAMVCLIIVMWLGGGYNPR